MTPSHKTVLMLAMTALLRLVRQANASRRLLWDRCRLAWFCRPYTTRSTSPMLVYVLRSHHANGISSAMRSHDELMHGVKREERKKLKSGESSHGTRPRIGPKSSLEPPSPGPRILALHQATERDEERSAFGGSTDPNALDPENSGSFGVSPEMTFPHAVRSGAFLRLRLCPWRVCSGAWPVA